MYQLHQIPFFQELEDCQNILLAGAGGGFDIYSGIPLYHNLKAQGKNVILANFSFSWLDKTTSEKVFPHLWKVNAQDGDFSTRNYFPEKYLSLWFLTQEEFVDVYAFDRTGVQPLKDSYNYLIKEHNIDAIVLVDGGTDSLMFGDEDGLGTPQEDSCSMAAVYQSKCNKNFLLSIGFGIDHFHGVSHYRFLENVAELSRDGGYLGLFQPLMEMEEAKKFQSAVEFANKRMPTAPSIVANSILNALEGGFGDVHKTHRTKGSELFINPLMTIHWAFYLDAIIHKNKYYDYIKNSNTMGELNGGLMDFVRTLKKQRAKKQIPI